MPPRTATNLSASSKKDRHCASDESVAAWVIYGIAVVMTSTSFAWDLWQQSQATVPEAYAAGIAFCVFAIGTAIALQMLYIKMDRESAAFKIFQKAIDFIVTTFYVIVAFSFFGLIGGGFLYGYLHDSSSIVEKVAFGLLLACFAFVALIVPFAYLPERIGEAIANAVWPVFKWLLCALLGWGIYEMFHWKPMIGTALLLFIGIAWWVRKSEQRIVQEVDRRVQERLRPLPPR